MLLIVAFGRLLPPARPGLLRRWLAGLGWLVSAWAGAQPVSEATFPALETGMHTGRLWRFAADRAGRYGVSASDDKTARVWDLANGRLLRTLRVPLDSGDEGRLFAVAMSPDGERVAVGGWTGPFGMDTSVYLFEARSGRLVGRIPGFDGVVQHLAWSPDGRRLAVALGGNNGIRLHAAAPPYAEVARDTDYAGDSYSVDFDPRGRLVSTGYDGKLRLYNAALRKIVPPRLVKGGGRPFIARFAPDGRRIAVGFEDSTAVSVVSGSNLAPLQDMDTSAVENYSLNSVAWSKDGRRLFAAGRNQLPDGRHPIRVFDAANGRALAAWPVSRNSVLTLQPLADGRLAFAGQGPMWGIIDAKGVIVTQQDPPIPDHRTNFDHFRVSPAGDRLNFLHTVWQQGQMYQQTLGFDLRSLTLSRADALSPSNAELAAPRRNGESIGVKDWENTDKASFAGRRLVPFTDETTRSLAISADASHFVLGTEWNLRWYDAQGTQKWLSAVPGNAWLVNITANGRFVVAALGDGTIRWYRTDDGGEALALFVHADGRRWVVWMPEGFFASSPDGEGLMGYVLNQGRDKEAEFVSAEQFGSAFYRPDLIARRIDGDEDAVRAALAEVGEVRQMLLAGLPPQVELLSESDATVRAGDDYELKLRITPRQGGVGRLSLRVNGAAQDAGRDPAPIGGLYSQRLRYSPGTYRLEVAAYDARGHIASRTQTIALQVQGAAPKPRLHLLAAGVSKAVYADSKLATAGVEFADRDALAFVERMAGQAAGGRLYRAVTTRVLTSRAETSRDAIEAAIAGIPFEAGDTVAIFLAGHGRALKNKYHFLPAELALENEDSITQGALTQERLEKQLRRFATGRVLLVLDTCHAGAMTESRGLDETFAIADLMRQTGQVVLAASRSDELAFQDRTSRHGIFTLALLDGLQGADYDRDGVVDVEELAKYVAREVPARSERANPGGPRQVPMRSPTPNAFPLVPVTGALP